jgi:hypothetical protein
MRRKGRSAGYLFCGARLGAGCPTLHGTRVSLFVCVPVMPFSLARIASMGRFFRLGRVRDIGADARVPQLASFRPLRFR